MPGALLHVPRPPKKKGWAKAGDQAKKTYQGAKARGNKFRGAPRGTTPGERSGSGEKFGTKRKLNINPDRARSALAGLAVGSVVGSTGGWAAHSGQKRQDRRVMDELEYQRAVHKRAKEGVHLITDLGTKGERTYGQYKKTRRRWPKVSKPAVAVGLGAGGGASYAIEHSDRNQVRQQLERQYKSPKNQTALKQVSKKDTVTLERFTPTKKERWKQRGEGAAKGAGAAAVAYPALRMFNREVVHSSTTKPAGLPRPKVRAKRLGKQTAAVSGLVAGAELLGHRSKEQYQVKVHKSAFGVEHVGKGRLMSDAEIKRRKRTQGHVSQVTGGLGLAALGGTLAASRGGRGALRKIPKLKDKIAAPPPKDPNRDRIKSAVTPMLATSAGLGGLGSFNFAAYTNAESRKRKAAVAPVRKSYDPDLYSGEEGLAKNWTPNASTFDAESKRAKRSEKYPIAAAGASGALAGGAAYKTGEALSQQKAAGKYRPKSAPKIGPLTRGQAAHAAGQAKTLRAGALKSVKGAALLTGGSLAAAGGSAALGRRKKSESWQPYAKRDATSAFGIDHTEWTAP